MKLIRIIDMVDMEEMFITAENTYIRTNKIGHSDHSSKVTMRGTPYRTTFDIWTPT